MPILNLGVLAHVDAGKTSLTERLLFAGGVIDAVGSVDAGSTQTDSLALERRRGITIKTAVASFPIGDLTVNLIDTPGHPDFIAEVERALLVLDGAILVISAVEGVQAQTRVLMRTLRRQNVPTLIFVNKIDRRGAREASVLREIAARLTPSVLALSTVEGLGTSAASARPVGCADADIAAKIVDLSGDESLLADYVRDDAPPAYGKLREALGHLARTAALYPVFFGSAVTGAGIGALLDALSELLPTSDSGCSTAPASGRVFKVERDVSGARVALVRLFDGTLRTRDHLPSGAVVTAIDVIEGGAAVRRDELTAGRIGRVHGLRDVRIGDPIGVPPARTAGRLFAPPTLSSEVVPRRDEDRGALHAALAELADQDPLINLRSGLTVSLYGEVQKEVIQTTLAEEYGITADFRATGVIHVERPIGSGTAGATLARDGNPYWASADLRIDPAPPGEGVSFALRVPIEQVPIHVFRTTEFFIAALEDTVRRTLADGPHGRAVIDARVTVTRTGFRAPLTTAADFRKLLPELLAEALAKAGTVTCEPINRFVLDGPADTLGATLAALSRLGAAPHEQEIHGDTYVIRGLIPGAHVHDLEKALPGLTRGEGMAETEFDSWRPVRSGKQ